MAQISRCGRWSTLVPLLAVDNHHACQSSCGSNIIEPWPCWDQGGGVFGRLSQQQAPRQEDTRQGGWGRGYRGIPWSILL